MNRFQPSKPLKRRIYPSHPSGFAAREILPVFAGALILAFASNLAAQSDTIPGLESSGVPAGERHLLGPPIGEGPVVVRAHFRLRGINQIDDEAENFDFTGVLTLQWKDDRQAFDPRVARVEEKNPDAWVSESEFHDHVRERDDEFRREPVRQEGEIGTRRPD
jgi:hypothetical protein